MSKDKHDQFSIFELDRTSIKLLKLDVFLWLTIFITVTFYGQIIENFNVEHQTAVIISIIAGMIISAICVLAYRKKGDKIATKE